MFHKNKNDSSSSDIILTPVESKTSLEPKTELLLPVLEDPILDYIGSENFESKNYSPSTMGPTFFENRLPVIALLLHAVHGEYDEVVRLYNANLQEFGPFWWTDKNVLCCQQILG